jgi:arylsulfatase
MGGRTSLTLYQGMVGMSENVFINTKNRSHSITADVNIPEGGANGVIIAQAGRLGGWSLYLKDGKPTYAYNFLGLRIYKVASSKALPTGKATIRYDFTYDGGGLGKGGTGIILVNGDKVAQGRIDHTQAIIFSADEGADVGMDSETPVSDDYKPGDNRFTGKIHKVVVEVGPLKLSAAEQEQLRQAELARKAAE